MNRNRYNGHTAETELFLYEKNVQATDDKTDL